MRRLFTLLLLALLPGCGAYVAPGGRADFSIFGLDADGRGALVSGDPQAASSCRPMAAFPASIAVARVQAPGYSSYSCRGYGSGRYTLVTVRDVERDEDFDRVTRLPMVQGVGAINRLLVPENLQSAGDLRRAAATLHADMLLVYTFDTQFTTDDFAAPLTVLSLGILPTKNARVDSTASAVLIDTRSGYVYATAEATSKKEQLANAWTSSAAIDQTRRRAEREAFEGLVDQFEHSWGRVVATYSAPRPWQPTTVWIDPAPAQPRHADLRPPGATYRTDARRD